MEKVPHVKGEKFFWIQKWIHETSSFAYVRKTAKKSDIEKKKKKGLENIEAGDVLPGHLGLKACRLGLCGDQLGVELLSQTLGSSDL